MHGRLTAEQRQDVRLPDGAVGGVRKFYLAPCIKLYLTTVSGKHQYANTSSRAYRVVGSATRM